MKAAVKKIAEQVKALPESELDEFLSWLAEYEMGHPDEWDREIERDSQNGGPPGAAIVLWQFSKKIPFIGSGSETTILIRN